jgi:hypothetical protein
MPTLYKESQFELWVSFEPDENWRLKLETEGQWQLGSLEAEEHPLLEAVTKQRDWEHWSVCDSDM